MPLTGVFMVFFYNRKGEDKRRFMQVSPENADYFGIFFVSSYTLCTICNVSCSHDAINLHAVRKKFVRFSTYFFRKTPYLCRRKICDTGKQTYTYDINRELFPVQPPRGSLRSAGPDWHRRLRRCLLAHYPFQR